ncbi:hypothetical protein I3842_15G111500 [Carya illinoinensis]|uniref:Reverse transcriptase zinc-binding domain-containing protein n=1 Tax=Carya illinoinensis TaxID=32201 RepID=A0A922D708_CARIL|nr:hypothetical protein I3842_15G111500 [Carya illinoinensis]
MCRKNGETVDHLLLHCEVVGTLWNEVLNRMELAWVMLATMTELMASWINLRGFPQNLAVWKMVSICIMWCLWKEQNDWTFEDKEHSLEEFRLFFISTLSLGHSCRFLWPRFS